MSLLMLSFTDMDQRRLYLKLYELYYLMLPLSFTQYEEAASQMNYQLNWTNYIENVMKLSDTISKYFSNATLPDAPTFLQYNGDFNAWLQRLSEAFTMPSNISSALEMYVLQYL